MVKYQKATFAAGCFWSVELVFLKTKGVISTKVGYSGGKPKYKNPTYRKVCSGITGHAESIEITFDPTKTTYEKLVNVFWKNHNPTTKNRQGLDIGTQYRSVIFYHNQKQKEIAMKSKKEQQKKLNKEIVTEIIKATKFYPAEDYHQKYLLKQ